MCTVSFIPNSCGYYLAMNRDERLMRPAGLPPRVFEDGSRRVMYPREPSGGTWIALNDSGVFLALINWHRVDRWPAAEVVSRGEIVKSLATGGSLGEITEKLRGLPLQRIRPFRLIAGVPGKELIAEYGWDLQKLAMQIHDWTPRHWFSSGYDEEKAELERTRVCQDAWQQDSAGSIEWVRNLHSLHLPERGPFSICMHQPVAETVSYTEISLLNEAATMRYKPGSPCLPGRIYETTLFIGQGVGHLSGSQTDSSFSA